MKKMRQIGFLAFAIGVLSTPAWGAVPGGPNMDPISIDNISDTITWNANNNASENPATAQGAMKIDGNPVLLAHGGGAGAGSCGCRGNGADGAGASGNAGTGGNGVSWSRIDFTPG